MQGYPNLNINGTNTDVNRQALIIPKDNYRNWTNKYKLISLRSFIFGYSVYIDTYCTIIEIWTGHELTSTCRTANFYSSFWHLVTQRNITCRATLWCQYIWNLSRLHFTNLLIFKQRIRSVTSSWFMMHVWEAISKTRASCFIGVSKHSKTIKALGLRPRAFISFLVFGNPDETLALVFEILLRLYVCSYSDQAIHKTKRLEWP